MLNTVKKSQDFYKNRPGLTFLVLVTLGTMVFVGCGSDSTPGGSVKGKNTQTSATPTAKQSIAPTMVLMGGKGGSEAGKMGDIKKGPERKSVQIPGMATQEEMEARNAAAIKKMRSPGLEVNGITQEEMEARNAAAIKMAHSPGMEVMPGVTLEEMKKKNAAALANAPKRPSPAGGK
jgi:hypothetical protein